MFFTTKLMERERENSYDQGCNKEEKPMFLYISLAATSPPDY